MRRLLSLLIVASLLLATPALAINDDVSECNDSQLSLIGVTISQSDFSDDYRDLSNSIKDMDVESGDLAGVAIAASELQAYWWDDLAPLLPNCSMSQEVLALGGRMITELTIATSIGLAGYNETLRGNEDDGGDLMGRFQYHLNQWTETQEDFLDLIEEMTEML